MREPLHAVEWKPRTHMPTLIVLVVLLMVALVRPVFAFKPELIVQTGHSGSVQTVVFSPDGKTLVTVSEDKTIKFWEALTGKELRSISNWVQSVTISQDGKTIATAGSDKVVRLWEASTGKELRSFTGHTGPVYSVAFSPDGKIVASASGDKTVKLWETASGKELRTLTGHADSVDSVAFSPNGKTLVSAGWDKTIKLWETGSGKELRSLTGHSNWVQAVAFSPDGKTLASASQDKTVKLWDTSLGKELRSLNGHSESVNSVAFSPDGKTLTSASSDKTVKLWSTASGKELRSSKGHSDSVNSVAFSPNGKTFASASRDKTVKLWETASGGVLRSLVGHSNPVESVVFSPDGKTLASASGDNTVKLWETASSNELRSLKGHSDAVNSVAFNPDGTTLASASQDMTVVLWDVRTGRKLRALKGHSAPVFSVAFSPDGKLLVSASGDATIKLWDAASGKELRSFRGHSDSINSVAFSPDGKTLASASLDKTAKLWDAYSGALLRTLSGHNRAVYSVAFSPDCKTLASASWDKTVKLWEIATGKELRTLAGHSSWVKSVTFSPDGKTLASACLDKTIKIWEADSGKELRSLTGHSSSVNSVAFSPAGKTLVSAGGDTTIRLWEAASGQGIASLSSFGDRDWVVVNPFGQYDASTLENISSLVWVLPEEPMKAYPLEIFMKQYFEPGLLGRVLRGEKLPDVPPLSELNRAQPIVTIDGVAPHNGSTDLVDVTVSYQSVASHQPGKKSGQMSGVYDLKLFRDGQLVAYLPEGQSFDSASRVDLSKGSDKKSSHTFTVKLPHNGAKNYSFSAIAFNVDQVKSLASPSQKFEIDKALDVKKGRAYVIAFGVNQYEDPSWNLKYAVADAREYETTLIPCLRERGLFSEVVPIKLVAPSEPGELPATKETLRDVLKVLSGNAQSNSETAKTLRKNGVGKIEPEDFVLLSFSCHGATNEKTGEFYLFPSNIGEKQDHGLTPELEKKGISSAELTDWVKDIDASDTVLVIDACHSGAAEGKEFKPGPMGSAGLGQLAYYKKMTMLSASQAASKAKETSNLGHGLLTFALLNEGLAADGRADSAPKDKRVYLKELLRYASEEVPRLDQGGYKTRSIDDVMSGMRDFTTVSKKQPEREVQTPVFRDFSDTDNLCVLEVQ